MLKENPYNPDYKKEEKELVPKLRNKFSRKQILRSLIFIVALVAAYYIGYYQGTNSTFYKDSEDLLSYADMSDSESQIPSIGLDTSITINKETNEGLGEKAPCDLVKQFKRDILMEIESTNFNDFINSIAVKVNYLKVCENDFVLDNRDKIENYRIASIAVWNCNDFLKRRKSISSEIKKSCATLYDMSEFVDYNQKQRDYMKALWREWANRG